MAEEVFVLIMLVVMMLVGSYIAGSIPLIMKLSEEKLIFITVLGAGLLVGTALTVIIPEGIRALYMDDVGATAARPAAIDQSTALTIPPGMGPQPRPAHVDHSRTIGLSLVLGFVFMMLVDQISQQRQRKNNSRDAKGDKNFTATLGLVVHAAADGVALGAAATTSHQDVEIIVFLAIMLHKAPAAFGLVSFLLHEKIERQQIRQHLAIFSLSAPLLTLLTYFGIGQEQKETLSSVNATGIAMLFSAGTFLYVATVHVLPELTQNSGGHHAHSHHAAHAHSQYEYRTLEAAIDNTDTPTVSTISPAAAGATKNGLSCCDLATLICGALLPLVITIGHQH